MHVGLTVLGVVALALILAYFAGIRWNVPPDPVVGAAIPSPPPYAPWYQGPFGVVGLVAVAALLTLWILGRL